MFTQQFVISQLHSMAEEIIQLGIHLKKMVLYGSYSRNEQHQLSDIDVAVVSNEMTRSRWKGRLKLREVKRMVDDRIEPHGFSPEEFKQNWMPMVHEIKKTGIRIR